MESIGLWVEGQSIDSAMLAMPVASLDMVDPLVTGIPERR